MTFLGLSGGMDSVALFYEMMLQNTPLTCIHVNHSQTKYDHEAQTFCIDLCNEWRIPLIVEAVKVTNETNARNFRYQSFKKHCNEIVLGHHGDDSIETMLLNLLHGTGIYGARGIDDISQVNGLTLIRPFIARGWFRSDIVAYLNELEVSYYTDYSNHDVSIKRNFIRHQILPSLYELFPQSKNNHLRFMDCCRKQRCLNNILADYTQQRIELGSIVSKMETENWFYCTSNQQGYYPTSRHFKEYLRVNTKGA